MTAWVRLVATFIHDFYAIGFAANISKRGLLAERWLRKWLPAISALKSNFVVLSLLAVHTDMVRVFLATSAEVVGAASASDTVSCHVLCGFSRHALSCFIFGRIIWLRRIEREHFVTIGALDNVIGIGHHDLRLLFANILKPLVAESLAQVLCLYHGIALTAAALREISRRQLRQELLLGICPEALNVELMVAAVGEEHLHLSCLLVSICQLGHAIHAVIGLESTHVNIRLSPFLLFHGKVVDGSR